MITPLQLADEPKRLESLRQYDSLDAELQQALDDLVALAAHICESPVSQISFVDQHFQRLVSRFGISVTQTSREVSFCGHAIREQGLFIVPGDFLKLRPKLPILLSSGRVTEELRERARAAGIAEVLHKPNSMEEISEVVHRFAVSKRA